MGSLTDALKKAEQEQAEDTDGLVAPSEVCEAAASSVSHGVPTESEPSESAPVSPSVPAAPVTADIEPLATSAPIAAADPCDSPPTMIPPTMSASESESASAAAASEQLIDVITELEARLADAQARRAPKATAAPPPAAAAPEPPPAPAAPPVTPHPAPEPETPEDFVDAVPDAESLILVPTYRGPAVDRPVAVDPPSSEARTVAQPTAPPPPQSSPPPQQVEAGDPADGPESLLDEELAEPYRVIRRRLIDRLPRERNLVVAVVGSEQSGEAGAGESWSVKSVATLNLGSVLAEIKGTTAVVVEANFSSRSISQLLGISEDTPGLANVLRGEAAIEQVIHRSLVGHLDVISAGTPVPARRNDPLLTPVGVEFIAQLRDRYDFVLVDAASSPSAGALEVYHDLYSGVLVVTTTDQVDQRHAKVLLDRLETHDVRVFGCILATPDEGSSEEAA